MAASPIHRSIRMPLSVVATITAQPEHRAAVHTALLAVVAPSRAEKPVACNTTCTPRATPRTAS